MPAMRPLNTSPQPILPVRPGGEARVIQGFFPGGRPRLPQPAPMPVAQPAMKPVAPAPIAVRPAPIKPAGRVPIQPAARLAQPFKPPHPISPNPSRPPAVQPQTANGPQVLQPILAPAPRPAAVQPTTGHAFAVPASFSLRPSGTGQRLPEAVQQKMEAFFGTSFADVRVHVGNEASSIGALAFTHGSDLYFSPGQYNPQSPQGQQLLGHELTHVVQQRAGRVRNPLGSGVAVVQDPALEAEAERMGMRALSMSMSIQSSTRSPRASGMSPNDQRLSDSRITPGRVVAGQVEEQPVRAPRLMQCSRIPARPIARHIVQRMEQAPGWYASNDGDYWYWDGHRYLYSRTQWNAMYNQPSSGQQQSSQYPQYGYQQQTQTPFTSSSYSQYGYQQQTQTPFTSNSYSQYGHQQQTPTSFTTSSYSQYGYQQQPPTPSTSSPSNPTVPQGTTSPVPSTSLPQGWVSSGVNVLDANDQEVFIPSGYKKQKGSAKYDVFGKPGDQGTHITVTKIKGNRKVQTHNTNSEQEQANKQKNWQDFLKKHNT